MGSRVLLTGIRAVDLFAPLPVGGEIVITGDKKAGVSIVAMELANRLSRLPSGPATVNYFIDASQPFAEGYEKDFRDCGPPNGSIIRTSSVTSQDILRLITNTPREAGEVFFALSHDSSFLNSFSSAFRDARAEIAGLTLTSVVAGEEHPAEGFDAKIILNKAIAENAIYPAIDPMTTRSSALTNGSVSDEHEALAAALREKLDELLQVLNPKSAKDPNWAYNADPKKRPILQALTYLSQPFFCTEPYVGTKGAFVPIEETVQNMQSIISGKFVGQPVSAFYMKNSLTF